MTAPTLSERPGRARSTHSLFFRLRPQPVIKALLTIRSREVTGSRDRNVGQACDPTADQINRAGGSKFPTLTCIIYRIDMPPELLSGIERDRSSSGHYYGRTCWALLKSQKLSMRPMSDPTLPREAVIVDRCPTCGSSRSGPFCAGCGERYLDAHDLSASHFFRAHLVHEFFEVDGRVVRILRSLFTRPGELARDFVVGRRQRSTSPLRLYLVAYLLHALIDAIFFRTAESIPERAAFLDPTGLLSKLIANRSGVDWGSEAVRVHLAERAHWLGELGTFLIFLGVAAVQAGVFYRLRRTYVEHLTLAVTVSAWFLSMLILGDVLLICFWHSGPVAAQTMQTWIALIGLPIYWTFAVRQFYGLAWLVAAAGGIVMTLATVCMANVFNLFFLALLIVSS